MLIDELYRDTYLRKLIDHAIPCLYYRKLDFPKTPTCENLLNNSIFQEMFSVLVHAFYVQTSPKKQKCISYQQKTGSNIVIQTKHGISDVCKESAAKTLQQLNVLYMVQSYATIVQILLETEACICE